jgi:hemerythrin superfamily protein
MDALDLLIADHNRVRGLFTRYRAASGRGDTTSQRKLADTIFTELEVHTTIEEEVFYPAIHDASGEIGELVDEGIEEHHVADHLMHEIRGLDAASDEWAAKMTVLLENVEHHADEEETEMFPKVRSAMADDLDSLATQLEERKRNLGAPVLADKIDLTKEELLELAREQEIPGRSTMDHDELAATVSPS